MPAVLCLCIFQQIPTYLCVYSRMLNSLFCIFYCLIGTHVFDIYFGVKRFEEKYEEDFEGQNMSFWDGICGFFAKRSPLINRVINTLTIFIICIGIIVSLTNRVCVDANQFGQKTYNPTFAFFYFCVLCVSLAQHARTGHIFGSCTSTIQFFICRTKAKAIPHMAKTQLNYAARRKDPSLRV